jgi:hypothetical protein
VVDIYDSFMLHNAKSQIDKIDILMRADDWEIDPIRISLERVWRFPGEAGLGYDVQARPITWNLETHCWESFETAPWDE